MSAVATAALHAGSSAQSRPWIPIAPTDLIEPLPSRAHLNLEETLLVLRNATAVATAVLAKRRGRAALKRWWVATGHAGQVTEEIQLLREVVLGMQPQPSTVCEVGFNAGHSAIAMLEGTRANLVEFDMMTMPYSQASRMFVESRYPGRTTFHVGPSQDTLPAYAAAVRARSAPACDLWFIDGSHEEQAGEDMKAALLAARDGAIVIADDATDRFPMVQSGFAYVRDHWLVVNVTCMSKMLPPPALLKGWCIGRYRQREGQEELLRLRNDNPTGKVEGVGGEARPPRTERRRGDAQVGRG